MAGGTHKIGLGAITQHLDFGDQSQKVRLSVLSAQALAGHPISVVVQINTPGTINAGTFRRLVPRSPLQGEPRIQRQAHRHQPSETG